jgi:hypothetical protein
MEKLTKAMRYNRVCNVLTTFWRRLVAELSTHLRGYNKWIVKTRRVEIGDIALLLDQAKRGTTPLVCITGTQMGIDGEMRRIICFNGFKYLERSITNVAVLLPAEEE